MDPSVGRNALGGPDGSYGPHAFVADLDQPELAAADRHHLDRVLRLRSGDPLTVSDGAGRWRPCRFGPEIEVVGAVETEQRRSPALTIAFAPVKGDRPEWVVQKLTELGVDRIVVLEAERSVVRWDSERAARQLERLAKVAREAAMQCRRCLLPEVGGVVSLAEASTWPGVVRADAGGSDPSLDHPVILIGPEGGWSAPEQQQVPTAIGLADHVLRAETAAVTAGVVYAALRANRVGEPSAINTEGDC